MDRIIVSVRHVSKAWGMPRAFDICVMRGLTKAAPLPCNPRPDVGIVAEVVAITSDLRNGNVRKCVAVTSERFAVTSDLRSNNVGNRSGNDRFA